MHETSCYIHFSLELHMHYLLPLGRNTNRMTKKTFPLGSTYEGSMQIVLDEAMLIHSGPQANFLLPRCMILKSNA